LKFPHFEYARPDTLNEAVDLLSSHEDAKALAGGQSLLPLMALRLARPALLVELSALGLDGVELLPESPVVVGPALCIGAMARQSRLLADPVTDAVPLLAAATRWVGHRATRNRGTVGGSLAHADPAAELPAVAVALGAVALVVGPRGRRPIPCQQLADGHFTTTLADDEIITEIHVPVIAGRAGAAFCEWAPRSGDFAEVGIGVALRLDRDGRCDGVWAGGCGLGAIPEDLGPVLARPGVLGERSASSHLLGEVARRVRAATARSGDDKSSLAGLLAARAFRQAFGDTGALAGATR
jgi:CO/xanthine dehydrogenase FAD-binding subunit